MFLLPVSAIAEHCNPYEGCWLDVGENPITLREITRCLAEGKESLTDTAYRYASARNQGARRRHVQKVAYFVRHRYGAPVQIDVGVPRLSLHIAYFVQDGNHRLAADIYRSEVLGQETFTSVEVSGDIGHAKSLGLWPRRTRKTRNR
jgi:hypothetical protein